MVRFDGTGCVGECGDLGAEAVVVCVEGGDVFGLDAAFTEVVACNDGSLCVGEDDACSAACFHTESADEVETQSKSCCHVSVRGEVVNDQDVIPFGAGRYDAGLEAVYDECTEG